MTKTFHRLTLISLALAASVQLAACGGGSAGAPDIFPPTVVITSDAADTASGPVTFTFTFNEDVGSSFTADDILVTGGTAGPLTRVSATQYTMVVTPPETTAGTIQVTVAAASFSDAVGNLNTVNPTVEQPFSTIEPGASGNSGTCTGDCIDFASASVGYTPFEGLVAAAQADDPADATNKVARLVKGPAGQPWAGATIYTIDATDSVPAFDLSSSKVVTLRVFAPAAGIPIMLKLEDASDKSKFMEKIVNTTQSGAWETLSFDFTSPSNGTFDAANTYNRVSLFPNFLNAETVDTTYYFDELKYTAKAVVVAQSITFASGFKSNNRTVEDGEWGFYSSNFTDYAYTYSGGCYTDGGGDCVAAVPASDTFVYLGVGTSAPTTDGYMGIFTMAPGYTVSLPNAGVTLSGQTTLKIELGWSKEWYAQASNTGLLVRTIGAQKYDNGSGGVCQVLLEKLVTPTTADLVEYAIDLSSMTLAQGCNDDGFNSGVTTVEQALTKAIGEVHVQAVFPRVNTSSPAENGSYPTGFSRGSIVFE